MDFLNDRRIVLALAGGALALLAGMGIAVGLLARSDDSAPDAPPASQGGLVVETTELDEGRMDPARPLRCFVGGQFVGEVTLSECAERNGVATGALDVGVDETGALAAADEAGTVLTPLPPPVETAAAPPPGPVEGVTAPNLPTQVAQPVPARACRCFAAPERPCLSVVLTLHHFG